MGEFEGTFQNLYIISRVYNLLPPDSILHVLGWSKWVEPAFLLWKPEDPDYERPVYDPEKAKFTAQEELDRMREQVNQSDVCV